MEHFRLVLCLEVCCPLSEVIFYRVCIWEYFRLVLCLKVCCPLSEVIFYRVCIWEYFRLVLCLKVCCPLSEVIFYRVCICNSYTMHAKAASVLSARAQGHSPRARADKN